MNEPLDQIEIDILNSTAAGNIYKETATLINRAESNVKWHALILRAKLGARTMAQAVAIAIRNKIIP